jgi:hypothetical protein
MNYVEFTVKIPVDLEDEDCKEFKEVKLRAIKTDLKHVNEAQLAYNRGFDVAMRSKAPLRIEIERLLKERGIWTETNQAESEKLNKQLAEMTSKLLHGGMKLMDARKLALEIRKKRNEISRLNLEKNILDQSTAEAQAESARFNWFVANCVVYPDTGKPFFVDPDTGPNRKDNVEYYLHNAHHDFAVECAKQFGRLQYGLDSEFEKKFPENKFLLKFKFVREKDLRLINRDGHLIDEEGHLVNEDGMRVDKNDNPIDRVGTVLDKDTYQPKIESVPFLDDDGNPIEDSVLQVEPVAV